MELPEFEGFEPFPLPWDPDFQRYRIRRNHACRAGIHAANVAVALPGFVCRLPLSERNAACDAARKEAYRMLAELLSQACTRCAEEGLE